MKSAKELIDDLNMLDESVKIEAKRSSKLGRSYLETVCAFANEPDLGGGYILLGVEAVENSFWPIYEVVGIKDADKMQSEIASQCATAFNVAIRPQISIEEVKEKVVIVVFVPEAAKHEKPVFFKNSALPRSAMRRIGPTDQRCTEDDMVVFYQGRTSTTYDEHIIEDATIEDFDVEAIELYRKLRLGVDPDADELLWNDLELLEALSAVKRKDGKLHPTVAGIILFGRSIALRRLFPMMRIDYIRVPGLKWVKDPDRRFDTVEIRAPLLRAIQRARSAIIDDLPKAFSLPSGEVQGRDIPLLPDRVVREVVANAVMHRDYRTHGSIQIIRYSNRLEIRNPGYSLKSEDRLGQPGSEARNPKIAAVLHDVRFAETKGSGIRVMRELMDAQDLSPPQLESDRSNNSFLALLLFHHFLSEKDIEWLKTFSDLNLSDDEMRAVISTREVGAINNSVYRSINRESDTLHASKHLKHLCDVGILTKKGQGATTYYELTQAALDSWDAVNALKYTDLDPKYTELEAKHTDLDPKYTDLPELANAPKELILKLQSLGGKSKRSELISVIVSLLKWKDFSLEQLGKILDRNSNYIRIYYLSELVKAEVVALTIPDKPNDPNQKYRYVGSSSKKEF